MWGLLAAVAALVVIASSRRASASPGAPGGSDVLPFVVLRSSGVLGRAWAHPQPRWSVESGAAGQATTTIDGSTAPTADDATLSMLAAFATATQGNPAAGEYDTARGVVTFLISRAPDGSWVGTTSEGVLVEGPTRGAALQRVVLAAKNGPGNLPTSESRAAVAGTTSTVRRRPSFRFFHSGF